MSTRKRWQSLLLFLTLSFIWGHSCIPTTSSAEESGRVLQWIAPFLEFFVGKGAVTDHLVRKLAHFTEYAALGPQFFLLRNDPLKSRILRSIELSFFVGFFDETIQILSDRGPQIADVWLDTAGAAFGVAICAILLLLIRKSR